MIAILAAILVGTIVKQSFFDSSSPPESQSRAISDLRSKIIDSPDDPALRVQLADEYLNAKEWQKALDQANQALGVDENYLGALYDQSMAYRGMNDIDNAIPPLEKIVELTKDNPNLQNDPRIGGTHYFLAEFYLAKGDAQRALTEGQAAYLVNKADADAIFVIGRAEAALGDDETALDAYETATSFDPTYLEVYTAMEAAANRLNNTQKAAYARGMHAIFGGDVAGGVKTLEDAAGQTWDDQQALSRALLGLAWGYEQLGREDDARDALTRSLTANPQNVVAQQEQSRLGPKQ